MENSFCFEKALSIISRFSVNRPVRNAAKRLKELCFLQNHSFKTGLNINPDHPKERKITPSYLSYRESFTMYLFYLFALGLGGGRMPYKSGYSIESYSNRFENYQRECLENEDYLGPEFFLIKGLEEIFFRKVIKDEEEYLRALERIEDNILLYVDVLDERTPWVLAFLSFIKAELSLLKRDFSMAIRSYRRAKDLLEGEFHLIDEAISSVYRVMELPRVSRFYEERSEKKEENINAVGFKRAA